MSYLHIDAPQRSPEWFAARLGRVTGSRAKDVMATIKSGEAAARRDYRLDLVTERLTGLSADAGDFVSQDMARGVELEPEAFAAYEAQTGAMVRRTGFLQHTSLMAGVSLDGDVHDCAGIIEIKCPRPANHLRYLRAGTIPAEHRYQCVHGLWISGAAWCDFVTYCPAFPEHLRLSVIRMERDEPTIAAYVRAVEAFLAEVDLEESAMRGWSVVSGA